MSSDHPWRDIDAPQESNWFNGRRIPDVGSDSWGLYWAVDRQRHCVLLLRQDSSHRPSHRLPILRGIRIEVQPRHDEVGALMTIRLTEGQHREIFFRFCKDLVASARTARSAQDAMDRIVGRTWRWHRLLRIGHDGRLSAWEQKGLVGELRVLERHLLPLLSPAHAVRAWVGPLGGPKDFQVGLVSVEAKAHGPQASEVAISSAKQLDSSDAVRLFLHVTEIAEALGSSDSAVTVTEVINRVRNVISARDSAAERDFEERLLATGFDWADDYSDRRWLIGEESLFEISEGFPRITPATIPAGVHDVRYKISLSHCQGYRVQASDLAKAISRRHDGD